MKRYRVTDTTGNILDVRACDWMMAMSEAMKRLQIEAAGWVCHSLPDGAMYVADPMTGAAWSVEVVHDATPPGALRRVPPPGAASPAPFRAPGPAYTPPVAPPEAPLVDPAVGAPADPVPVEPEAVEPAEAPPAEQVLPEEPPAIVDTPLLADLRREPRGPADPPPDLAERLFERSMDLSFAEDSDGAAAIALEIVEELVPCEAISVLLGGLNDASLRFAAASGPSGAALVGREVGFGEGLVGAAYDLGITIRVTDASADRRHFAEFDRETGFETHSALCAPIRRGAQFYGVIECLNAPAGFQSWHVEVVETVAQALAANLAERESR